MSDERPSVLRREVLPPPSTSSGWGLIMVAATALSFALAGSLLMLRATEEAAREQPMIPVVIDVPHAPPLEVQLIHAPMSPPAAACGGPVYHANDAGHAEAVFELCPPQRGQIKRIVAD
jgi:hypothetical protein